MDEVLTTIPDFRARMSADMRQVIDMSNFDVTFKKGLSLILAGLRAASVR